MNGLLAAIVLSLRFTRAVIVSGIDTIRVIIRSGGPGGKAPSVALVRVRFAKMSARGAALLGSMVSLTPGTTTLDIDMERYELLLHVLDASDTDALVRGIREEFEPGLLVLFGDKEAAR
jgi:multisubunit Na+/H+ antiporter MnhE subunit